MASYKLKKSKFILQNAQHLFKKKHDKLSKEISEALSRAILNLQNALLQTDPEIVSESAKDLDLLVKSYLKRSLFERIGGQGISLIVALLIAILIRQVAFELFEIPSGSMRPTFKEQDRLVVSKSQFGLNIPLTTSHFLFSEDAIKRMGVVIFTGENMDIPNVKTRYFYLFPGYRQYIKRMIGLPGDTLYFYGGKIYGIDKNGNDVTPLLQRADLSHIEHIPFIHIEGKTVPSKASVQDLYSSLTLKQMNIPLTKLYLSPRKDVHYEMLKKPVFNDSYPEKSFDLYDFWGIKNFANVRLMKRDVFLKNTPIISSLPRADFYLEITHHPSVIKASLQKDPYLRLRPTLHIDKSFIPLTEKHLKALWNNLYTGRFIVKDGEFYRLGVSSTEASKSSYLPKLKGNIPDGTYEFYKGALTKVLPQAILVNAEDNPLAKFDPIRLFTLFNGGIECDTRFIPESNPNTLPPARYAYFKNGDLYIMGSLIIEKDDPALVQFVKNEEAQKAINSRYEPFIDHGPPLLENGNLDIEFVKAYGVTIPKGQYLVLGDNHAMSGDSREFGFVPENNLRGIPSFMFWAPGGRFGYPNHGIYPLITTPRMIVWSLLTISFAFYLRNSKRKKQIFSSH
jgi:signal peptidase I